MVTALLVIDRMVIAAPTNQADVYIPPHRRDHPTTDINDSMDGGDENNFIPNQSEQSTINIANVNMHSGKCK